eukprot:181340_1
MEIAYDAATNCYKELFKTMSKVEENIETAKPHDEGGDTVDEKEKIENDKKQRMKWKRKWNVEIYSESCSKWYDGTIVKITKDVQGEWLTVAYRTGGEKTPTLKQIQRFNKEIRVKQISYTPNLEFANRIIFLTDAQPNQSSGKDSLLNMVKRNSSTQQYKGFQIHTTFIGVGLDFNTKFVEDIIKVEGGNYYAVHSNKEFMKTMDEE